MSKFVSFMDKAEAKFDSLSEKYTGVIVKVGFLMILAGIAMGVIGSITGNDIVVVVGRVTLLLSFIPTALIHVFFFAYNMSKI